jgi:hypothetical protein
LIRSKVGEIGAAHDFQENSTMTTKLLAPAPYAQIRKSGGFCTVDQNGVIAAAADDVVATWFEINETN